MDTNDLIPSDPNRVLATGTVVTSLPKAIYRTCNNTAGELVVTPSLVAVVYVILDKQQQQQVSIWNYIVILAIIEYIC